MPTKNKKELPWVSIVMPAFNEERNIGKLLQSIKKQSYKNIETIVVDDGSKDRTVEISRKFTKKVYPRKHAERSAQRNFGVSKSKGDYLVILDADMVLEKDVVKECVEEIQNHPEYKALVIPERSFGEGIWSKAKAFERSFYLGDSTIEAARFFEKKVFNEFGGYDLEITGPEDWDLPQRISKKYKIGRIKSFILHNEGRHTLWGLMKKKFYYAKKSSVYLKKHNKGVISPSTVYFLRPSFYKNWKKMLFHPVISVVMFVMLTAELFWGGVGFLMGKVKNG